MSLNETLEEMMQSDAPDLIRYINLYIQWSKRQEMFEFTKVRFNSLLKDKMLQLNIPYANEIMKYISNNIGCYSQIDAIQSIEEGKTIVILGKDRAGQNVHKLIPNNYENASFYDSFMMDDMFYKYYDCFGPGISGEEAMENYNRDKNEIYQKYAQLINKAFEAIENKNRVEGAEGYNGVLSVVGNNGCIYINDAPAGVVDRYESKSDFDLFTIIFIDKNNTVLRINAKNEKQNFVVDGKTAFDNLLTKHSANSKSSKFKKYRYYNESLDDLRKSTFDLQKIKNIIFCINMPPYITQDNYYYQRPLDIATEKLIQLLNIPYLEASTYIEQLNDNIKSYITFYRLGLNFNHLKFDQNQDIYAFLEKNNGDLLKKLPRTIE